MKDLPPLPSELWTATFNHLRVSRHQFFSVKSISQPDVQTLKTLYLTSRWFHVLVEPLLYEWLVIANESPETLARIGRLTRSQDLANMVRCLVLNGGGTSEVREAFSRVGAARLLFRLCHRLVNLRAVHLESIHLPAELISEIIHLPSLTVWESHYLGFLGDTKLIEIRAEALNLSHVYARIDLEQWSYNYEVEIINYGVDIISTLALSRRIQVLDMQGDSTRDGGAIPYIKPGHHFRSLTTLKIQLPLNLDLFYDFARHCPNVTDAELVHNLIQPTIPAPGDVLPNLKTLKTSVRMVSIFAPGRPIESLDLTHQTISTGKIDTVFKEIAMLVPGLKSLRFLYYDVRPGYLTPVAVAMPGLEELRVYSRLYGIPKVKSLIHCRTLFVLWLTSHYRQWEIEELAGLSFLRVLHLKWTPRNPEVLQEPCPQETMDILLRNHPLLEEASVGGTFSWRKGYGFRHGDAAKEGF